MTDFAPLIKNTGAYKAVEKDIKANKLSHAYLIVSSEKVFLTEYLKIFSKLILCENKGCNKCRTCKLVDQLTFSDLKYYPKNNEKVLSEDIVDLIEESYYKPTESNIKLFIIDKAETMTAQAQNKLLKTLEEPPNNVCILIGANGDFNLLPTVKSRVKKLEISTFSNEQIFSALKEGKDEEKLKLAISCGDGTLGKASLLYDDENLKRITDYVIDTIVNMNSSKDVLDFSVKASGLKCEVDQLLSVFELAFRDLLFILENKEQEIFDKERIALLKEAKGFNSGAVVHILEKIVEGYKRHKFNANSTMLIEWFLFSVLEGKHIWRKL